MKLYFNILGLKLPSYGIMIVLGVILSNLVALLIAKKYSDDTNDFLILEAYTWLGAFFGSKLLYLVISIHDIEWDRLFEADYFNQIMRSGFVVYGGLIGGLIFAFVAGRIHKLDTMRYVRRYVFLIPLIHSFGRIGCFLAGCCYGMPYEGIGAVSYPDNSLAPNDVHLFPVQLVEAFLLICIAVSIVFLQVKCNWKYSIETYLIVYGVARFVLEFFRYDAIRGELGGLSTSQWISIGMIVVAISFFYFSDKNK